jgi:hypothetical protein
LARSQFAVWQTFFRSARTRLTIFQINPFWTFLVRKSTHRDAKILFRPFWYFLVLSGTFWYATCKQFTLCSKKATQIEKISKNSRITHPATHHHNASNRKAAITHNQAKPSINHFTN